MENNYIRWLMEVGLGAKRGYFNTHSTLLKILHTIPYEYTIRLDKNRAGDAMRLRSEYEVDNNESVVPYILHEEIEDASILEVLVGLCRRIETEVVGDPGYKTFVELLENLRIWENTYDSNAEDRGFESGIRSKIKKWLDGNYTGDGYGSPFPLKGNFCRYNQKGTELWVMMNRYYINKKYLEEV